MALALRLGLQQADIEDVAQETMTAFVRAYRRDAYKREKGRLRDWLCGMALNKVRDLWRRVGRQERQVADNADGTGFWGQVSEDRIRGVWDDEWEKAILQQCLEEVRQEVSPRSFEAFQLFALQQLPAKDVAKRLQLSEDSVYQTKHRILARIRELLPEMDQTW